MRFHFNIDLKTLQISQNKKQLNVFKYGFYEDNLIVIKLNISLTTLLPK